MGEWAWIALLGGGTAVVFFLIFLVTFRPPRPAARGGVLRYPRRGIPIRS